MAKNMQHETETVVIQGLCRCVCGRKTTSATWGFCVSINCVIGFRVRAG